MSERGGKLVEILCERIRNLRAEVETLRAAGQTSVQAELTGATVKAVGGNPFTGAGSGLSHSRNNPNVLNRLPEYCPSSVPKDKASWGLARDHIRNHELQPIFGSFADSCERWQPLPLTERGLSLQFFQDFHSQFRIKQDFTFLAVLWLVQILTAVTGFSLAEVMGDARDAAGVPYRGRANRFVSHATAHTSFEDYDALASYSASSGGAANTEKEKETETLYYFIDVFGINQSDVGGADELPKLEELIQGIGHTVLIFNTWHDPEVVRRVW